MIDPDTYQKRDVKRRLVSLEKSMVRAEARIRALQALTVKLQAFLK